MNQKVGCLYQEKLYFITTKKDALHAAFFLCLPQCLFNAPRCHNVSQVRFVYKAIVVIHFSKKKLFIEWNGIEYTEQRDMSTENTHTNIGNRKNSLKLKTRKMFGIKNWNFWIESKTKRNHRYVCVRFFFYICQWLKKLEKRKNIPMRFIELQFCLPFFHMAISTQHRKRKRERRKNNDDNNKKICIDRYVCLSAFIWYSVQMKSSILIVLKLK